jgi:hypothetical protein
MGITKQQPGAVKAAATTGVVVGTAAREKEDRARVEREQVRADQEAAQRKARQTAMAWDLQKMQLRSQQEFEQELRTTQYSLDRFNRAKEWDIEKMELRSRIDFEQEEKERIREIGQVDAKITAVKKAQEDGMFTGREFEYESMLFNLEQQRYGVKNPSRPLDPQKRLLDQMMRQREADASGGTTGLGTGVGPPPPTGELTVKHMEAIAAVGKTYLRRKDTGELVEIPIGRAKDAVDTGRFTFPSVSGVSDGLLKKQFPDIVRQETAKPQRGSFTF